jgi:hypothetical protein
VRIDKGMLPQYMSNNVGDELDLVSSYLSPVARLKMCRKDFFLLVGCNLCFSLQYHNVGLNGFLLLIMVLV